MSALRWIQAYYLGSPLFLLAGVFWGFELRTTFLPDPVHRLAYYGLISALGLLTYFRPRSGPWVALGESSLNLLLLVLGILLPVYRLPDQVAAAGPLSLPYSAGEVLLNGVLAGTFFVVGFYRAQAEILRRFAAEGRGKKKKDRRGGPPV
jgi:hypothetical protein